MTKRDIDKCIKNGRAYRTAGNKVFLITRQSFSTMTAWWDTLHEPTTFADKRSARLAIATRREDERVAARKEAGTQVSPETPEQRDARIKALVEGYKAKGGPITKEQLTDEVREYLKRTSTPFYSRSLGGGIGEILEYRFDVITWAITAKQFWNQADANHDKMMEDGKTQMTPITAEQAKMIREGDTFYYYNYVFKCITASNNLIVTYGDQNFGCYFTLAAAQAALDKQKAAPKKEKHKFAELPNWCPPLLEGDVPLGFGNTFKTDGERHTEIHAFDKNWCNSTSWDCTGWEGAFSHIFYAAPLTSEIAKLNYPWLSDEEPADPEPPKCIPSLDGNPASYDLNPDYVEWEKRQADPHKSVLINNNLMDNPAYKKAVENRDWDTCESIAKEKERPCSVTPEQFLIRNHGHHKTPHKLISFANYKGSIPETFTLDMKNLDLPALQKLIEDNFVSKNKRKVSEPKEEIETWRKLADHELMQVGDRLGNKKQDILKVGDNLVGNPAKLNDADTTPVYRRVDNNKPTSAGGISRCSATEAILNGQGTILEEAAKCVTGLRRRDYGTPDENFGHIAALWSVQLKHAVTPMQVAMCLILLKVARQNNSPKRDNLVDIAGYAQCASELTDTAQELVDQAQKLHMGYDEGVKP